MNKPPISIALFKPFSGVSEINKLLHLRGFVELYGICYQILQKTKFKRPPLDENIHTFSSEFLGNGNCRDGGLKMKWYKAEL